METNPPSRKQILIWLILSQVLAVASLFFWLVMAGLSVMAFDSGVTQEAWNFVIAVSGVVAIMWTPIHSTWVLRLSIYLPVIWISSSACSRNMVRRTRSGVRVQTISCGDKNQDAATFNGRHRRPFFIVKWML